MSSEHPYRATQEPQDSPLTVTYESALEREVADLRAERDFLRAVVTALTTQETE